MDDQQRHGLTPTLPRLRALPSLRRTSRLNRRWTLAGGALALVALLSSVVSQIDLSRLGHPPNAGATATSGGSGAIGNRWEYNPAAGNSTAAMLVGRHEADITATAENDLQKMTLDEKLGQMFLIETYYQTWTPDIANMVVGMHAGAIIIYAKNMQSPSQLRSYIASIQAHASNPLLVTMDEEGGLVDRLGYNGFFPPLPAAEWLGSTGKPALATAAGVQAAQEMRAMGINTDLAPVVDVLGPHGSVETTRLYGSTSAVVSTFAGAYLDALQNHGIVGTLKHWPGIGNVVLDPHKTLPTINDSLAQLEADHYTTFQALLSHDPGMIMVTHVIVQNVDPTMPATLSPKMVDGVLRGKLGYNGVVMTDSLYMQGIALRYNLPEAGVLAVIAGDDLLEGAFDTSSMTDMIAALKAAIASGRITLARIDQSVLRILRLKIRFGLLPLRPPRYADLGATPTPAPSAPDAPPVDIRQRVLAPVR